MKAMRSQEEAMEATRSSKGPVSGTSTVMMLAAVVLVIAIAAPHPALAAQAGRTGDVPTT